MLLKDRLHNLYSSAYFNYISHVGSAESRMILGGNSVRCNTKHLIRNTYVDLFSYFTVLFRHSL